MTRDAWTRSATALWPMVAAFAAWKLVALALDGAAPELARIGLTSVVFGAVAACVAYVGVEVVLLGRSPADIGLATSGAVRGVAGGLVLGALVMGAVFLVFWVCGWYRPSGLLDRSPGLVGVALLGWCLVALTEEVVFRGMVTRRIASAWGTVPALVLSALVFGAAHAGTAVDASRAVVIGASGALLFGSAYLLTKTLWLPIGIHAGWNIVQDAMLGGDGAIRPGATVIDAELTGPVWATGGTSGPEAGIVALAACATVGLMMLVRRPGDGGGGIRSIAG